MADKLVVDLRIYTIRPRGMPQYLKLFEELALPLALKYLSEPLGYYVTQIGPLNQVVHLWGFENLADMEQPGRPRRRSGFCQIPRCDGRSGRRAGGSDHADGRVQKPVLESAIGSRLLEELDRRLRERETPEVAHSTLMRARRNSREPRNALSIP